MISLGVREARENHAPPLTQEQLADRSGVDQTYISLIERGLRNPSDTIKARLAQALGIAPSMLRFSEALPKQTTNSEGAVNTLMPETESL
jgi:transcriptional regulator with XRE-family HTH domain